MDMAPTTHHPEIACQLHQARLMGRYNSQLKMTTKASLLIIDDYGLFPLISPPDEDFYELIAMRHEQRSTLITSNLDFTEWDQVFVKNKPQKQTSKTNPWLPSP